MRQPVGWWLYPTLRYGRNSWRWSAVTLSNRTCATAGACTILIRLYSAELSAQEPEDAERALKSILQQYLIRLAGAAEWLTAVTSEIAERLYVSPQHAAGWFEAERTTAIAIVMSLAKRTDYRKWILVFAVTLGEILSSQRHWLQEFHDVATVGASLVTDAQDRHYATCALNHYVSALRKMRQFGDALEFVSILKLRVKSRSPERR